jgi:DNA mismatch repair protein MutS2
MKINARQSEVRVLEGEKIKKPKLASAAVSVASGEAAKPEIDLRGMTADEAVSETERFLDMAEMRHMETVTVIHGKGTGVLRTAVQQALKRNPQVKSFRLGRFGEGEAGVTIVELK